MYLAHILAFDRQQACFRSFCLPELDPGYNMQLGGRNVSSYVYGLAFSLKGMLNNLTPFIFFFSKSDGTYSAELTYRFNAKF